MEEAKIKLKIPANTSVKRYMKKMGYPLREPCHGRGECAECAIRVCNGELDATLRDILRLPDKSVLIGYRLGCQAITRTPVTIEFSPSQIKKPGESSGRLAKLFHKK